MLVAGLVRRRFEVAVVTTDPPGSFPEVEVRDMLTVRRFPTIRRDDVFFLSPSLTFWLLTNAGAFDLIHAHSYHTPLALVGAIAARLRRVPFVISPHYHGTGHTAVRRFLHRPYRSLGAWMIRQAALVICCSEAERSLIRLHFGAGLPIKVVEYGVDAALMLPASSGPANGKMVLTGGRLEEYKQVGIVVKAMEHLSADFRLVIFGAGPALEDIRATARERGVLDRVEFVGRVTDAELGQLFRTACVFVSMSRNEAFGLTVVEAAAVGTPVVSSDIEAYREMAGRLTADAIHLVDVDADPAGVATAIRAAADAPRPTLAAVSTLPTWDGMAAETVEGYRSVLFARGQAQHRRAS